MWAILMTAGVAMVVRVIVSLGLLALGYYVGREIGRAEPIRKDLKDLRDAASRETRDGGRPDTRPPDR